MQPETRSDDEPARDNAGPEAAPKAAPEDIILHMPIDVRSASLALIGLAVGIYMLNWAAAVFIPLLLGVMLSYAISPLVARLEDWRIPRSLGASLVLATLVFGAGSILYSLSDDAAALAESLPDAAQKLRESVDAAVGDAAGAIGTMQRAATKIEEAAAPSGVEPKSENGVTRVQIEQSRFSIRDYLWNSTLGLVGVIGQSMVVIFITFFLLVSGDGFRRKMVRIAGPTFAKKKITLQLLDEISQQIQRFLMIQCFTSVLVGVATWLALLLIGLDHAAVWGLAAAALNLVPYLGAVVTAAGLALVSFLQFGTLGIGILIGGGSLIINTIEGNLLTPWLMGRASSIDPVVIFVGVLAFGWLWGIWGLFLGPPLLMSAKAVCDRVDSLKRVGELLGA